MKPETKEPSFMLRNQTRKTMRDVTSSLVGSSFRRVYRDGRVTYSRRIMTLRDILDRTPSSTDPRPRRV
jgi:hypothetical protein